MSENLYRLTIYWQVGYETAGKRFFWFGASSLDFPASGAILTPGAIWIFRALRQSRRAFRAKNFEPPGTILAPGDTKLFPSPIPNARNAMSTKRAMPRKRGITRKGMLLLNQSQHDTITMLIISIGRGQMCRPSTKDRLTVRFATWVHFFA